MKFGSDNTSGIAPEIMDALVAANRGYASGYGDDEVTVEVEKRLCEIFDRQVAAYLVPTGSAANALALSVMTPPWGVIFCHETAHVQVDEAGAPHLFAGGAKIVGVPGASGKMKPDGLAAALNLFEQGVVHSPQPAVLSLTNLTEWGTVYSANEIATLAEVAHSAGCKVHVDGARFANALAGLGCQPAELTWRAGVDALSFGATKNGAMGVEAVVFFNPEEAGDFIFRRKQGAHLLSKHRFLAAQMDAYLKDDLWLHLATHANAMAQRLADGLTSAGVHLAEEPAGNEVFPVLSDDQAGRLRDAGAYFYDWVYGVPGTYRLVCSFSTQEADVDRFLDVLIG